MAKGSLGASEAAAAVGGDADEACGVGWSVREVLVLGATVGTYVPFTASPILAEVGVSDVGISPWGEGAVERDGDGFGDNVLLVVVGFAVVRKVGRRGLGGGGLGTGLGEGNQVSDTAGEGRERAGTEGATGEGRERRRGLDRCVQAVDLLLQHGNLGYHLVELAMDVVKAQLGVDVGSERGATVDMGGEVVGGGGDVVAEVGELQV